MRLLDLPSRRGRIALHAAQSGESGPAEILGIEVSPEAPLSADHSAEELSSRAPLVALIFFRAGDATDVAALGALDAASLSWSSTGPAAASGPCWPHGSSSRARTTSSTSSCNVDSLARDLAHLPAYTARDARLFLDMLPQTAHHEVMVLLERAGSETSCATRDSST